jgi:anti-sigma regulatory factor (Ser/Thr protein kinase)
LTGARAIRSPFSNLTRTTDAPSTHDGMERLMASFNAFAARYDVHRDVIHDVYVALDEIISNAVKYGGRGALGRMSLHLSIRDGSIQALFCDNGRPFNPLSVPRPRTDLPLDQRPIGGLSILFVKSLMDGATYERCSGWNRLTLTRSLQPKVVQDR